MNKTFHNPTLGGLFGLQSLDHVLEGNRQKEFKEYGILISLDAKLRFRKDGVPQELAPRSVMCLSPHCHLEMETPPKGEHYMVSFNSEFYCLDLHDKETSCNGLLFNSPVDPPVLGIPKEKETKFRLLIKVILEELEEEDPIQEQMLTAILKRLLILCAREYREILNKEGRGEVEQVEVVRKFNNLVEKHFRQYHQVGDYAQMMNRAPKTLSNLFLRFSDQRPLEVIHNRLFLEARRLLFYTDKSAKEIAFELGFEEPSHFGRFFKKKSGTSPTDFRKKSLLGIAGKN